MNPRNNARMHFTRSSGVLVHPTSLPGPTGIGDIGPDAHRWIDQLGAMGCALWQVLPLGPTGYADSPYQSFSSFAGNPNLISPSALVEDGLLETSDLDPTPTFPAGRVDYGLLIPWKRRLIDTAFERFGSDSDFETFKQDNRTWLDDFALFMTLKDMYGGSAWTLWPPKLRDRDPDQLEKAREAYRGDIERHQFAQFLFGGQWKRLHDRAQRAGISIIGDIPIFTAADSADVWANRDLFQLDEEGRPSVQAGVPPDYFSETGQLWGNPLYDWEAHRRTGYAWWIERFRSTLRRVDVIRIDHFRGFVNYWEVPGGADTAIDGRWVDGPGEGFFRSIETELGTLPIIAEDLGEIDPRVPILPRPPRFPGNEDLSVRFRHGPQEPVSPPQLPEEQRRLHGYPRQRHHQRVVRQPCRRRTDVRARVPRH